jgi:hypothetical protein
LLLSQGKRNGHRLRWKNPLQAPEPGGSEVRRRGVEIQAGEGTGLEFCQVFPQPEDSLAGARIEGALHFETT